MATDCIPQLTFKSYPKTKTVARFDQAHASTDGGVVLLKALDDRLQLTNTLAACLPDRRNPDKVRHAVRDLLRQRIFGLACGYEDGNDAARLVDDPLHKLAVGRDPVTGDALASQPTLSRFEHAASPRALYRMGRMLASTVIAQHRHRLNGRAQRITIDLDPTDDPTHGQQELAFFKGHYDTWCYLPQVATLTFNDEAEQYLVAIVLRPGNSPAKHGAFELLRTLLRQLRRAFPGTPVRVRVDGGFAGNDWLDFLEADESSMWWGWPATRGWSGAPGVCWARPTACRSTVAARSTSTGRHSMRPRAGRIVDASSSRPRWYGSLGGIPNAIRASW